ncbi:MAG: hypothetical protein U0X39_14120 [Bacteroidales bacterium]
MNRATKIKLIVIVLSFLQLTVQAQDKGTRVDKYTLLTMPFNLRQLTLYRGQIQFNAGYRFSVRSQSFSNEGDRVLLKSNGTGSVYHFYFADLRYGVTDFIEIGASTDFIRMGVREQSLTITSVTTLSTDRVSVNKLTEVKGFGDILLKATIRSPFRYRKFDISATGGIYLPSSPYEPEKPQNTVTSIVSADSYTVNYHYKYTNGYGVPVWLIAGQLKMKLGRFTTLGGLEFRTPLKEGTNIRWEENLVNKIFTYYDKTYSYLLSNSWDVDASIHYQPTGWFDFYINSTFRKTTGGWTEYWGTKYRNKGTSLFSIEPGFELQISPSLIISQVAGFPLSGKNTDAPFFLFTTVRYSIFPFRK